MLFWLVLTVVALLAYDSYCRGGWALAAIDKLIKSLSEISVGKTLFYLGLMTLVLSLSLLFGGDGTFFSALLAPELLAWFTLFDIAALIDVTVLVLAMSARSFVAQVRQTLGTTLPRLVHRLSTPRPRAPKTRTRKPAPPSSDPEPPYAFPLAMA